MSKREQLKGRFGAHQVWNVLQAAREMVGPEDSPISDHETIPAPSPSGSSGAARRSEYKGKRKQVAFRLRESACRKVKLVLELRRGAGNDFFEAALEAAADAELARLRGEVEPAVWKMAEVCVVEKTKN